MERKEMERRGMERKGMERKGKTLNILGTDYARKLYSVKKMRSLISMTYIIACFISY